MEIEKPTSRILKLIFKDFASQHSVTSVAKEIGLSRQGTFKILKKLESEKLLLLSPVGKGKTSTYLLSLNWQNPLVEKMLALFLTEEALKHQRPFDPRPLMCMLSIEFPEIHPELAGLDLQI